MSDELENLEGLVSALRRAHNDIEYAICYRDEGKVGGFKDLELLLAEINQLGNRANELARQAKQSVSNSRGGGGF